MKKLILSAVLLAGLSFVACSKDDDKGSNKNCVTCTFGDDDTMTEEYCKDELGLNQSQFNAFINAAEDSGFDCN
ncbi:MAG: hypothetical protein EOP55_21725 [Sphingobacteriales bacterium]|nr:MAG: hypothetical protein EOP55_21725 [Sphingobacteriales bacterium]